LLFKKKSQLPIRVQNQSSISSVVGTEAVKNTLKASTHESHNASEAVTNDESPEVWSNVDSLRPLVHAQPTSIMSGNNEGPLKKKRVKFTFKDDIRKFDADASISEFYVLPEVDGEPQASGRNGSSVSRTPEVDKRLIRVSTSCISPSNRGEFVGVF
jgi:hypothetical protein